MIKLTWQELKNLIDNNAGINYFYSQEKEYQSNSPDAFFFRYYIIININYEEYYCFISFGTADQVDFDTNYKSAAIPF